MTHSNPNNFDELLRSLQSEENGNGQHKAVREVGAAIHATMLNTNDGDNHFSLAQLAAFVQARRTQGEQWEAPTHLSACQTCLENFSILLEGVPAAPTDTINRFVALRPDHKTRRYSLAWRMAAAAALVIVVGVLASIFLRNSAGKIESGGLKIADSSTGAVIPSGNQIPAKTLLEASQETLTALPDGSRLTLTSKTRFAVVQSSEGDTTVDFKYGQLTASIAHQQAGKHFRITTPLGNVTVIGTKFTVTSHNEAVTMFNNDGSRHDTPVAYDGNVKAVVVAVQEGVVLLNNSRDEARVTAGKTAILRDQSPIIEVLEK